MSDDDYIPPSSSSSSDGADSEQESTFPDESAESVSGMRKFLVFEHNLLDLFSMCQVQGCGKPLVTKPETSTKGFALSVRTTCIAGHDFRWNSQPSIKGTAACNILVPAAIFITGNSYSSFMELCDVMNLQALSTRQCYSVQRRYIIPEVEEMWELHNTAVLSALHGSALVLSGDARCDSPGHITTLFGKSSQNNPKLWSSKLYHVYSVCTLLNVVGYYDLQECSVQSMLVMGF